MPGSLGGSRRRRLQAGPTPPSPTRVIAQLFGGELGPRTVGLQTPGRPAPRGPSAGADPWVHSKFQGSVFLGWGDFVGNLVPREGYFRGSVNKVIGTPAPAGGKTQERPGSGEGPGPSVRPGR